MAPDAKRSFVWKFFTKEGSTGCCKLCKRTLKYFGSTENMKEHLKRLYPTQIQNITQPPRDVEIESTREAGI